MPVSSLRQRRANQRIHQEVSEILERGSKDPRLQGLTITRVETTADLRHARIYFTHHGSQEEDKEVLEALNHARGFLRRELAARLKMRFVPEVSFHPDPSLEHGERILQLLRQIESQKER